MRLQALSPGAPLDVITHQLLKHRRAQMDRALDRDSRRVSMLSAFCAGDTCSRDVPSCALREVALLRR